MIVVSYDDIKRAYNASRTGGNEPRRIVLYENLEKVISIPSDFPAPLRMASPTPPSFLDYYKPDLPTFNVQYENKEYYPWGYDFSRNVEIWRER